MASFNPISYFSPTSVFALSTFLPSYLVNPAVPQPEPEQAPPVSSEPRLELEGSEESRVSLRTEEVSINSADTQTEDKVSKELNNQHSEVFVFSSK